MPLPKPLKRGASKSAKKKVVSETMHDLKHGPHHSERTHKQEVAIALKQAGASKRGPTPAQKEGLRKRNVKLANRRPRNRGRS